MVQEQTATSELPRGLPREAFDGRSGAIYVISEQEKITLLQAITTPPESLPTPANKNLYSAVIEEIHRLCTNDPYGVTDQKSLTTALGLTRSGLLKRLTNMAKFGVKTQVSPLPLVNSQSFVEFYIDSDDIQSRINAQQKRLVEQREKTRSLTNASHIAECDHFPQAYYNNSLYADNDPKGERYSIFYLFPAFPSGTRDQRRNKKLRTRVYVGRDYLDLQIAPVVGTELPSVRDLQVLTVLITIAHRRMLSDPSHENLFVYDVLEILDMLQLSHETQNKKRIQYALLRLKRANLTIFQTTAGVKDKLKGLFALNSEFNLISNLQCLQQRQIIDDREEELIPDQFSVVFDSFMFKRMKHEDGELLTSIHLEALRLKNSHDFAFYLWLRRVFRYFDCQTQNRPWSLAELYGEIVPTRSPNMRRFKHDLKKMILKRRYYHWCYHGDSPLRPPLALSVSDFRTLRINPSSRINPIAKLPGYYIQPMDSKYEWFQIWVDPKDRIIGENSYGARMRQMRLVKNATQNRLISNQ